MGARYRPSLRIAAGGSGLTTPNTSGVARSRKTAMAKYRRWRRSMPDQDRQGSGPRREWRRLRRRDEDVTGSASIRWRRDAKASISPPFDLERLKPMKMERVAIARRLGEAQARQAGEQDRQRDASSSRASGAPTQKWMPAPKLTCGLGVRAGSKTSGSGKRSGSRLAAPSRRPIFSPLLQPHAGELRRPPAHSG